MRIIELWFGKWSDEKRVYRVVSAELEIKPDITSLDELGEQIRRCGDLFIRIRYAEELYGRASELLKEMLGLFDGLKAELGAEHFNYALLPREQVIVDFTYQKYVSELYDELRQKMDWEDCYGSNLSALRDILTGMYHKGDDFIIRRPVFYSGIPFGENMEFTVYVDKICAIFEKAERAGKITVRIDYTKNEMPDNSEYRI